MTDDSEDTEHDVCVSCGRLVSIGPTVETDTAEHDDDCETAMEHRRALAADIVCEIVNVHDSLDRAIESLTAADWSALMDEVVAATRALLVAVGDAAERARAREGKAGSQ